MDVSSGESTNTSSPKLTNTSKISKESISNQTGSPDASTLSPLTKSRYGRTRKPKISEDFYNIDVIFEAAKEPKKSPRAPQQIKPVPQKNVKPKVTQSPNKPKEVINASTKSPRTSYKSTRFVHITGDDEALQGGSSSQSSFSNDLNSKAIHNFFNEDSGMLMLQNTTEIKVENEPKLTANDISSLNEESVNLPSEDVTKVLKIISTRSPDPLQNTDSKTSFKPALKTYSNKRKNFHKVGVVESFGLPDTPIFPIKNDKDGAANEPKRIKNLDVASPTSENDINIVDKKLLDTPWKIANIDTDITESEVLLETSTEDLPVNTSSNSEILKSPTKLTRKDAGARPSGSDSKFQIETNKSKASPKGSPRVLRKHKVAVPKKPAVIKEGSSKNDVKSPKNKSPQKEKPVILKKSVQVSLIKTPKKIEAFTKEEIHASQARSPRKRKQLALEKSPLVGPKSPDISKAVKKQKLSEKVLSENIKSPRKQLVSLQKNSPVAKTVDNLKSPKKQMLETLKSPKSPRKQNLSVTLETHKEKKIVPKKSLPTIVRKDDEEVGETKALKTETVSPRKPRFALGKSPRKALTRNSPTKVVPLKRKRSESPKKPVPIQRTENLIVLQENTSPIVRKPRGRPKKISLEPNDEPSGVSENVSLKPDTKSDSLESAEPANTLQRDTRLSLKRSSRLAKPLQEPAENLNTETKDESESKPTEISEGDDVSQEVDEMNLLERKHLNSVDSSQLLESANVSVDEVDEMNLLERKHLNSVNTSQLLESAYVSVEELPQEKLAEVTEETEPQVGKKRSRTKQAKTQAIHSTEQVPENEEVMKTKPTDSINNITIESVSVEEVPQEVTEETEPQIGKKRSRTKQAKTQAIHSTEKVPENQEVPKTKPTDSIDKITVESVSVEVSKLAEVTEPQVGKKRSRTKQVKVQPIPSTEKVHENEEVPKTQPTDSIDNITVEEVPQEKLAEVTEETEPQVGKKRSRTKQAKTQPIPSTERVPENEEVPKTEPTDSIDNITGVEEVPQEKLAEETEPQVGKKRSRTKQAKVQGKVPENEEVQKTEPTDSIVNVTAESESDKIKLGDLMWARIRGFPYWPCLVTEDPTTNEFTKDSIKKHLVKMYHVRFFGDKGRRSWVYAPSLMKFTDKSDLKNIYEKIKRKSGNSLVLQSYIVKSNIRLKWENATAEAESVKASSVEERFNFFFNMFASDMEKRKRMIESDTFLEYFEKHKMAKDKSINISQSGTKSQSLEHSSNSSPPAVETVVNEEETNKTKDDSERPTSETRPPLEQDNKTKKINDTEKPEAKISLPVQKRASKIKERQESHDSSLSESTDTFLKSPWQDIDVSKKLLRAPLNEANSECSLSDSDSLSKSSTNTVVPNSFKAQMMRQKRNHLFRGIPRDRVCQICKKPGEILKCKGPCSGIFHYKCAIARYALEIKEELNEEEGENKHDINGVVDSTHSDAFKDTNDAKEPVECLKELTNEKINVIKDENPVTKPTEEHTVKDVTSDAETSNANNKVEIIYIDCDDSDFEHALTPKVRLTPSTDFAALSLAEQIDLKMKEVMQKLEKKTRYADSTTDYTSSEESSSNLLPPKQKPKITKRKSLKVKHVTADNVSFASSASSEDLICESTNADLNQETNGPVRVSSSENAESVRLKKPKHEKSAPVRNESSNRIEKHVTGDVTPQSESSNESNFNKDDFKDFKCGYCIAEVDPPCFVCDKEVSNKNESFRQKCSLHMCGKFYHPGCLKMWPQTQWSLISRPKQKNSDTFVCPVHVCHTCASDDPHAAVSRCTSDKVVKCLRCPATYHTTNYCVPAGTLILSTSQIVCPRHLGRDVVKRGRAKHARTINTPWCFICSKGGDLICCETCPTSVHTDCLAVNLLEDGTFICEDCETGRFPLYDEIVWVKLGTYRWWPALILFPNEIPDNIRNMPHNKGEFVVKFFGTHDHYWVSRGRVFLFQEGDRGHCSPTKKRVDALFKKSIEEAAAAHQVKKLFKSSKEAEIKTGMKPPPYIRVKVNRAVGNVRLFDGNISNTTSCECDPKQDFPCGPDSDCLNRILLTECDPNICPAKERCNNQRFEKRQYPPLVPYRTQGRGWGLKTLAAIRKGDFVIEYVGEIIDEQEYQRRIRKMHEQKDENYYFLTIDKDRIIDAGPKGNLARFMNHCCQPNCETQKWTVNGNTRVGLFAVENVAADAELTFNYNLECIGKEKKICKCGAPNCSGFIGVKAKSDESQKKPKKSNNSVRKKKRSITPQVFKSDGPCFICGKNGDVSACHNKICTKFYHLKCVNLEFWPEGKWVCPWHNCNMCTKRTIRCCVKCINSYCPVHSEGNVRYDKLLGFVCSEHDPTKESHELSNQNLTMKNLKNSAALTTEETDVTSTTSDEIDNNGTEQVNKDIVNDEGDSQIGENIDLISTESVTSTPIKKKDITKFAYTLQEFESDLILERLPELSIPEEQVVEKTKVVTTGKRKRGRQKQGSGNLPKRIKLSDQIVNDGAAKPKPSFTSPNVLDMPAQNEVKLSTSVPTRHLRTTRNNPSTSVERFLKQQNELEKDLPIRKRSKPRSEATL